MNHVYKLIMSFSIVIVLAFVYLRWSLDWTLQRWGEKWQIRAWATRLFFRSCCCWSPFSVSVTTPVFNSLIRTQEYEADMYGLNTNRQPGRLCPGGDPSWRIPQDESRSHRGMDLFRSPQRTQSHLRRDALEG